MRQRPRANSTATPGTPDITNDRVSRSNRPFGIHQTRSDERACFLDFFLGFRDRCRRGVPVEDSDGGGERFAVEECITKLGAVGDPMPLLQCAVEQAIHGGRH